MLRRKAVTVCLGGTGSGSGGVRNPQQPWQVFDYDGLAMEREYVQIPIRL
jgi:hypothetical protein